MGHPETQTQETSRAHGPRLPEPSQTCQGPPRLRKGCLGPQRTGFGCFPKKDACTPPGLFCTQVRGSEQFFPGSPWGKNPNLGNQGLPRAHPVGKSAMIQARGAQKHPDHSLEPPCDGEIDLAWVNFCSEGPVSSPVLSGYFVSGQIFTLCPYRFALHPFFRPWSKKLAFLRESNPLASGWFQTEGNTQREVWEGQGCCLPQNPGSAWWLPP